MNTRLLTGVVAMVGLSWVSPSAYALRRPGSLESEVGLRVATGEPARLQRTITYSTPSSARAAWNKFVEARGGEFRAYFDAATGVPGRIYGGSIEAPGSIDSAGVAEKTARRILEAHLDLLAPGSAPADFVLVSNEVERGLRTVGFVQLHDGHQVIGGQLSFRFKNDRLFMIGSESMPNIALERLNAPVPRKDAETRARRWLAGDYGGPFELKEISEPKILSIVRASGAIDHHHVIEVKLASNNPIGLWSVYVDAAGGAPLARQQLLKFADGTIQFNSPERWPGSTRNDYPAGALGLTIDNATVVTDDQGVFHWNTEGPVSAVVRAQGPHVHVANNSGRDISTTAMVDPGATFTWNRAMTEQDDAQLITYIAAYKVQRYAKSIAPTIAWFDNNQLVANVNMQDVCNAYSDGETINFFNSGQGCENTGRIPDVVYHEFGHAVHFHAIIQGVGNFDTSLSEGASDFLAATMTGDHGMGRGFFFDNRALRDLDPTGSEATWPQDISQDPHETGLIFGGAMWDLRKSLIASMGDPAGSDYAMTLWLAVLQRAVDIPSSYAEVVAADDDDGNLANGTPNICAINDAFSRHGLGGGAMGIGPGISPPLVNALTITLPVMSAGNCPGSQINSATLTWQVRGNNSANGTITMTQDMVGYTAVIPPQQGGTVVQYKIEVALGDGTTVSLPDNPADPYYELFVGQVIQLYCNGFEGAPLMEGWSHQLLAGQASQGADDWAFGPPEGVTGSGDPSSAFEGNAVAGNDIGGANHDGKYQANKKNVLIAPDVDVMGYTNVRLQYRRWLTVEDGFYDHATILANDMDVWHNLATDMQGSLPHQDKEWRFQDVDLSGAVQDGRVQIKFQLESDPGLQFGGWTIDDFCIVAYGETVPVCGNGIIELGEVCDDGNSIGGDGCEANCTLTPPPAMPVCGNGQLEAGEACDDGNSIGGDGCEANCTITPSGMMTGAQCGNGIVEQGEECDDGKLDGTACAIGCKKPTSITGGQLDQSTAGCGCNAAGSEESTRGWAALLDLLLIVGLGGALMSRARARRSQR